MNRGKRTHLFFCFCFETLVLVVVVVVVVEMLLVSILFSPLQITSQPIIDGRKLVVLASCATSRQHLLLFFFGRQAVVNIIESRRHIKNIRRTGKREIAGRPDDRLL